jgi:hypothetical protein
MPFSLMTPNLYKVDFAILFYQEGNEVANLRHLSLLQFKKQLDQIQTQMCLISKPVFLLLLQSPNSVTVQPWGSGQDFFFDLVSTV